MLHLEQPEGAHKSEHYGYIDCKQVLHVKCIFDLPKVFIDNAGYWTECSCNRHSMNRLLHSGNDTG